MDEYWGHAMSRTHRFTLGLGVVSVGLLAFVWAHTDLSHDEVIVLLGSIPPLIYLQLRDIEVRALPSNVNEPSVTVTWSLTEAVAVPMAAVVAPAAAATLAALSGLCATFIRSKRGHTRGQRSGRVNVALLAGSMSASAVDVLAASAVAHAVLDARGGSGSKVVAVSAGVVVLQVLGLGWDIALYAVSGRPLALRLELEILRLMPLTAVLGGMLLLSYDANDLGAAALVMLLSLLLAESLRSFYVHALQLRRHDEEREHLLRAVLESGDVRRQALATRLHDGPLQSLLSSKMRVEMVAEEAQTEWTSQLLSIASGLEEAAEDLRSLMRDEARVPDLDGDLRSAIEREVSAFEGAFLNGVGLHYSVDAPVSLDVELLAFQIVHEALVNVQRHASAARVEVAVVTASGWLNVEVLDDGVGFEAGTLERATNDGHLGLVMMRERATRAGGSFSIDVIPAAGTSVRAGLPLA